MDFGVIGDLLSALGGSSLGTGLKIFLLLAAVVVGVWIKFKKTKGDQQKATDESERLGNNARTDAVIDNARSEDAIHRAEMDLAKQTKKDIFDKMDISALAENALRAFGAESVNNVIRELKTDDEIRAAIYKLYGIE